MRDLSWLVERPIAHRGLHDLNTTRWENTLSAFAAAIARNYAIECDLHLSSDGIPMVFHDTALKRLTGRDGLVHELTANELARCRVGRSQDTIPSLGQLLALVDGQVPLVLELKGNRGKDGALVGAVAKVLAGYHGRVALMSFDHWLIRQFASQAPGLPRGLTACGIAPAQLEAHFSMLAHDIDFVSFLLGELPNPFVTMVRERLAMPVISWTVREPEAWARSRAHADQITFEGFEPDLVPEPGLPIAGAARTRI